MTASQVREEALLKPGELGLLPREETGHGLHEDVIGRHRVQPTRLFQGQDALHPPTVSYTHLTLPTIYSV